MQKKEGKNTSGLHDGHRKRLREKFKISKNAFAEHELIELLLTYAIPRKNTNDLAHKLLKEFGSLSGVLNAPIEALACVDGVGENSALLIALVGYLTKNANAKPKEKVNLSTIEKVKTFTKNLYLNATTEKLYLLFLDENKNLLGQSSIDSGSVNSVTFDFETFSKALMLYKPTSVILVHNHFADFPYPSSQDDKATAQIYTFLNLHKVSLYDHVIVGKKDAYSYFYDNRIQKIKESLSEMFI